MVHYLPLLLTRRNSLSLVKHVRRFYQSLCVPVLARWVCLVLHSDSMSQDAERTTEQKATTKAELAVNQQRGQRERCTAETSVR